MHSVHPFIWLLPLVVIIASCTNSISDVNSLLDQEIIEVERAEDVVILYSDSARLRVKVESPILLRHIDRKNPRDEFPKGVRAEFYDEQGRVSSWLVSNYAIREESKDRIIARDSVVLFNQRNEKIETSELVWDERQRKIYTDKFHRITQPAKGDTTYGYGFETDQNFTRFEVKRKFSAKTNVEDIRRSLDLDPKPSDRSEKPYLYPNPQ